ncbi:MAG: caspase family protein [Chloroflexi bacterium]|nr:caspase family protein [Chloroflexota bacterium]
MEKQHKGLSLHIGINLVDPQHYGGWDGKLNACEADAEDMRDLANGQGFTTKILKTRDAVRKNVITEIRQAAASLDEGDIFLLTYSGHGGQIKDLSGDEADLMDETWVLYDGELIDDELYNLWAQFKPGVRIFVLSDSCHSGTVIKDVFSDSEDLEREDEFVYRFMPADVALATYRANKKFYQNVVDDLPPEEKEIGASVKLISGCQDSQFSLDGQFNGLFTGTLLRVWKNGGFKGDYSEFHQEIVAAIPEEYDQTPNYKIIGVADSTFDDQRPFAV